MIGKNDKKSMLIFTNMWNVSNSSEAGEKSSPGRTQNFGKGGKFKNVAEMVMVDQFLLKT